MSLTDHSASDLMRMLSARQTSAAEVMADHLARIAALNPQINALVSLIDPDAAMAMARAADAEEPKGWLHGLPLAPKDLVATKGLRTTWGSPLFADFIPAADDLVAARMRAAGGLFIGKSNTPEWGHGSHSFNPVHGTTRNPYDLTRSAGGSSGGAAAALAARLVPVADGSDMMGSLRNPAAFCNVYGFRPTWGLVPQDAEGDTFLATLSTEGPMARTIEDLARLLETLAGPHPETPFGRTSEPFADRLDRDVTGLRIGWLGDWGGAYAMEDGILDQCRAALGTFEELGAIVEEIAPPFPAEQLWQAWTTLRAMLNAGGFQQICDNPGRRTLLKPETLWEIEQGRSLTAAKVHRASTIRSRWYVHAARLFARFDALAMPAAQVWPFPADWRWPQAVAGCKMDTYHRWMEVVVPVSLIGLPSLCLPAGFGAAGLPTGVQLIGPTGGDAGILAIGQAYHRATDWPGRRPPPL
jgi:amidase